MDAMVSLRDVSGYDTTILYSDFLPWAVQDDVDVDVEIESAMF
jgi:hypothetical protein